MATNRTEFAILGLLAQGPKSGYDIKKLVEERLSHFWNESVGHLYPILKRLRERGWVERTVEATEGRPPRHEYQLTERGWVELEGWFHEPIEPIPPRNELLLKLFLGASAPEGALREQVRAYRNKRAGDLELLESIASRLVDAGSAPERPWWAMTVSAGIHAAGAAVAWCDEVLAALEEGTPNANAERA